MDLDRELHNLIKLVSNVTDAYTAALFWLAPNGKKLTLRSVYSLSKHLQPKVTIELGSGIIGWVAREGKVNASPFKHDPKTLQLYTKEENIKSFLAVPVKIGKETKGVLCVDSKKAFIFTSKMEKFLHEFAEHISHTIERDAKYRIIKEQADAYINLYRLYKELNGFHKENIFELLINISHQLFYFDTCILSTFDQDSRQLSVRMTEGNSPPRMLQRKFPAQEGIASLVLRTKKPLLLTGLKSRSTPFSVFSPDDPFQDVGCFMGLPLLTNDQTIGFLGFIAKEQNAFGERDLQLATILSFQASSAISLARAHEQVRHKDKVDSLTGLSTHSLMHCRLEQAFQDADKHAPFSLLLLDMDGFNQLNQKYGYHVGDEVLKKVANILLQLVRDEDLVTRFGGEEFCILLKNSRSSRADKVAERIRQVIQQTLFLVQGLEIKLTASIGVAGYLENAFSKDEILHCAKAALAKAKVTKNSVCNFNNVPVV